MWAQVRKRNRNARTDHAVIDEDHISSHEYLAKQRARIERLLWDVDNRTQGQTGRLEQTVVGGPSSHACLLQVAPQIALICSVRD